MPGYIFALSEGTCGEIGNAKFIEESSKENYITKEEYEKLNEDEKREYKPF